MKEETDRKIRKTHIRKVGPYLLIKPIGKGSYSTVFEGKIEGTNRKVAVKVISLSNVKKRDYERVQMEIKILSLIRHENIVELLDFKKSARHLYLVFEHCQNIDLDKHIKKYYNGVMPEDTVRKVFMQIKKAFQVLRIHKIVHRDLKLANILVTEHFCIRIADFGFAGLLEDDMLFSSCVGTPLTMAPEVLDRKDYGEKCDIWSLGIILYQMLQGSTPFVSSQNSTLQALRQGISNKKLTFNPQISISEEVKSLIQRMIVNDPKQRMPFEQFFAHPWLREQVSSISSCLRQAVLQKEVGNYLSLLKGNQKNTPQLAKYLNRIIIYKLYNHYKSLLENKLYSYVGLAKKLIDWKQSSNNLSSSCIKVIFIALIILGSNIKTIEQCDGTFIISDNKVQLPCYNLLKNIESPIESEFSKSLPLLLKKSKALMREELTEMRTDYSVFLNSSMSLLQQYFGSLFAYIQQSDCQPELLHSIIKVKKHDCIIKAVVCSQTMPKQLINLLTSSAILSRLGSIQRLRLDQDFIRVYRANNILLRIEARNINSQSERQEIDHLYELLKELI